jgi:lysyl-tRNA synthetase class 2
MEEVEEIRLEKLRKIEELGCEPYPTAYRYTHTIAAAVEQFEPDSAEVLQANPTTVRVSGRIIAARAFGKAGFLTISEGGSRVQIYARKDKLSEQNFELYRLLDIGDFIGAEGVMFRTRTGELTVQASELTFLAKSLRSLPEKWHGLTDIEIRYRRRYVDLIVNQGVRDVFVKRSLIIRELRRFLDDRGYLEVETPILQPIAGGALARPFQTHHNALDMPLYLRIAPELYLKRLIVGGLTRVYDLNRNFRNEGISFKHNPEYTMLEFYQAYSNYTDLMDLTEVMITTVVDRVCGSRTIKYDGVEVDFNQWARITVKEAIVKYCPGDAIDEAALSDLGTVKGLLDTVNADYNPQLPLGTLIGELFDAVAEKHLVQPTFVYDYPIEMSPLSKAKKDDPSLVERFELYIAGMELANAYSELNDPIDQKKRFESQLEAHAQGDDEAHVMDADYVRALEYGMPPTAGEGIGLDRLTMLLSDSKSIRDVILFPHLRPE